VQRFDHVAAGRIKFCLFHHVSLHRVMLLHFDDKHSLKRGIYAAGID
jgi:hypothetical protein